MRVTGAVAACAALSAAAPAVGSPDVADVTFDRGAVRLAGKEVPYPALLSDWAMFSKDLKEKAAAGTMGLLCGERFPFPVPEWDGATGRYVWRQPAGPANLPALWREFAHGWLDWRTGALKKKSCRKGSCTLGVVFAGDGAASNQYDMTVSTAGGRAVVEAVECAGPVSAVLKLFARGETRWAAYAKALNLPEDSAPLSEYAVKDACYRAAAPERQPSVLVKLGPASGRIDTIMVTQGPWPAVTARFGAKKIDEIARTRITAE
ncbi:MAG: hypothetical protein HY897_10320 [Deltaproteobacteria bacterium]|nr:hypothetical protein [Deltaproteobacteria bacterium]